jgi:pimeloyl-ACP methyl ester carboxylesterase
MADLFSAYEVQDPGATLHAYLFESTAPDNIDDPVNTPDVPRKTVKISAAEAVEKIASALKTSLKTSINPPSLIISIHSFNNPRDVILKGYWNSFSFVNKDNAIHNRDAVCIGYRWPSERIGAPFLTAYQAAPTFLRGLLLVGCVPIGITLFLHHFANQPEATIFTIGIFAVAIALCLFLLRVVVYFRDRYRATSFGIPDLVNLIRQIDKHLAPKEDDKEKRVQLSFIGHSMGAYVVTSVVRILSDVFDPASVSSDLNATDAAPSPNIGHAFELARLVLVSPDIPAETLISNWANFLKASLCRFEEAFLFSNEGDEVLRQISTTANYFSFPTKSNAFGYRLGNICLVGLPYGISTTFDLRYLQVGYKTLGDIYYELINAGNEQFQTDFPQYFSYFDCTDCIEDGRGVLTLAGPSQKKRMNGLDHFWLLLHYFARPRKYDVHGGYFRSPFLSALIYRLACIGYEETKKAYGGKDQLDCECRQHQIRALLKS